MNELTVFNWQRCAIGAHVMVFDEPPAGMRILYAILETPNSLQHLRIAGEYDHYEQLIHESAA
jgi:hypothetical protein